MSTNSPLGVAAVGDVVSAEPSRESPVESRFEALCNRGTHRRRGCPPRSSGRDTPLGFEKVPNIKHFFERSIHWRASLVPAAAVIPAPIAYIKVVAVKKLVVGSQLEPGGPPTGGHCLCSALSPVSPDDLHRLSRVTGKFTLKKLECSKQARRLNNGAWNNGIGPRFYFVGFRNARRTTAKAFAKNVSINQERKLEVRRRSDTALVLTINDASQRSGCVPQMTRRAASGKPKLVGSGGSMVAKLKLKGIDGRAPPEMEPAA
ncbi:uncharacterized protein CDAR_380131 [Caerostris darwini]|uniref:Uncharacterized protein n=1 Tax=Caerostris darwini TaxID=1538125 RepID=A0AAV4TGX5_9ARAC|nr:uncharacterized protein CDAR_380131 [Caerostris darwini]